MHVRCATDVSLLGNRSPTLAHYLYDTDGTLPADGNPGHGNNLYDVHEGDHAHVHRRSDYCPGR